MYKLLWIVLVAGMLLSFGCNEADDESSTAKTGQAGQDDGQAVTTAPGARETGAPATGEAPMDEQVLEALVTKLAPEHGLVHDDERQVLTGEGFPEDGIPLAQVTEKVQQHLAQVSGSDEEAESAVNDILAQLASMGTLAATQRGSAPIAGTPADSPPAAGTPAQGSANEEAEEQTLLHPHSVFGDWVSIREEDGDRIIEHKTDGYYEYMELNYMTNRAMFNIYRNSEVFSHQEYPFQYGAGGGKLVLLGPADRPVSTLTIWAYRFDHPLEIWVQKEGSNAMTVFAKKGRAGEPLSEAEIEERERIMREAWGEAELSRDKDEDS